MHNSLCRVGGFAASEGKPCQLTRFGGPEVISRQLDTLSADKVCKKVSYSPGLRFILTDLMTGARCRKTIPMRGNYYERFYWSEVDGSLPVANLTLELSRLLPKAR